MSSYMHSHLLVVMLIAQAMLKMHSLLILIHTLLITSITVVTATKSSAPSTPKPKSLITKLIHVHSIPSLPNIKSSTSYWPQKAYVTNDMSANLLPRRRKQFLFFVNFSIGQQLVPQLAIMETGSSLLWVKCFPYAKFLQEGLYYPDKSSTYASMSCEKNHCGKNCNSFDQCTYDISYVARISSKGNYAFEQLTFETLDGGKVVVPNVTFGCSHEYGNNTDKGFSGVFGLDTESSLVEQLGSKFSYCVGSVTDPYYSYNKLYLGDGAVMEGYSTPFRKRKHNYYVTLEGNSIGDKRIDIDLRAFEETPESNYENGVIVDSGCSYTWLADEGYGPLEWEVRELVDRILPRYYNLSIPFTTQSRALCYNVTMEKDLQGFPAVTFHFANGADLVLDSGSMFDQVALDGFCTSVLPSSFSDEAMWSFSIIGMMAQQNYNVGYDLNENKLYFQRIDCELLED